MLEYPEKAADRRAIRNSEAAGGEDLLLERVVNEPRDMPVAGGSSLLRPQQHRNAVWRWHVRRRRQD
ncbi:MAG: hypothetical protein HGA45_07505 [Chloroflexales bacterium]|nr:hypothetical protein [Chloroflexales bacterium]